MKNYGQDLKNDFLKTQKKLNNITDKINKRFDLIISDYQKYIIESDKKRIMLMGASHLSIEAKMDIIINTDDNYIKENGNQLDLFE